jgi:hypothetical protein
MLRVPCLCSLAPCALLFQGLPEQEREPTGASQGGNLGVQLDISEVCDGDCFTVMGAGIGQQAREPLCQSCVCPPYLLFQASEPCVKA